MCVRTDFKLFGLFFVIYAYLAKEFVHKAPEISNFWFTAAIADRGTFYLDFFVANPPRYVYPSDLNDIILVNGHYFSVKAPGFAIVSIPAYLLTKSLGLYVNVGPWEEPLLAEWLISVLTAGILSSILVVLVYRTARTFVHSEKASMWTAIAYGLGTIALPFATVYWGHQIAAFFAFAAFYYLQRFQLENSSRSTLLAGAFSGFAVLSDFFAVFIVFFLFLYAISVLRSAKGKRRERFLGCFMLPIFLCVLMLVFYDYSTTGNPVTPPYYYVLTEHFPYEYFPNIFGLTLPYNVHDLFELLCGTEQGIFAYTPILLLSFVGFFKMYKLARKEALVTLAISISFIVYFGSFLGSNFRYLTPIMPFFVLPMAYVIKEGKYWKILGVPLLLFSIFSMTVWTLSLHFIVAPYNLIYGLRDIIGGGVHHFFYFYHSAYGNRDPEVSRLLGYLGLIPLSILYFCIWQIYRSVTTQSSEERAQPNLKH